MMESAWGRKWNGFRSVGLVCLVTLLILPLRSILDPINMALFYLIPVLLAAIKWGMWSAISAALFGVLTLDVFFVPPLHRVTVADTRYILTFIIFLGVAIVTGRLASNLKDQMDLARKRQQETSVLQSISREMTAIAGLDSILGAITGHIEELFRCPSTILLPDANGRLKTVANNPGDYPLGEVEIHMAHKVFTQGYGQDSNPMESQTAGTIFIPLRINERIIGVLGVHSHDVRAFKQEEPGRLLESLADLGALAIERVRLSEEYEKSRFVKESERLYSSIFNSVSHELRTPLSLIMAAVGNLLDEDISLDKGVEHEMLTTIQDQSHQMNRLLGNLLDMARIESGRMKLSRNPICINDLVNSSIIRLKGNLSKHVVELDLASGLPMIEVDVTLMEQVLVNLLDNAAKYSAPGTGIVVSTKGSGEGPIVSVCDMGVGVPDDELDKVFKKFHRAQDYKSNRGGTGLGLSICKGIIEAHGGRIWASNLKDGGFAVSFLLPWDTGR